jgi:hypothetical protein
MSTLAVVEAILRETQVPMSVRQIVEYAGSRLPTKSKTPDTVVARDLSMDIKRNGEASIFVRTAPGRYAIREIEMKRRELAGEQAPEVAHDAAPDATHDAAPIAPLPAADAPPTSVLASAMKAERAAPLPAKKPPAADEQTGTLS